MAHAQLGGMLFLAITGQKALRENWQANFQILDIVHMMEPITKRSVQVQDGETIPKEIREKLDLKKGDMVTFVETDAGVVIKPAEVVVSSRRKKPS